MGAELLTVRDAVRLRVEGAGRIVELTGGGELSANCVLIASGVSYNQLNAPGFADYTGAGIYYGAALTEARACADQHVVVIGGANSAGQAAVYFSGYASRVTMLVRADSLAKSMSHYLIEQIAALPNIEVRTGGRAIEAQGEHGHLTALRIRDANGNETLEPVDACFVFIGAAPRTDWLAGVVARDDRGFILAGLDARNHGWPLQRDPTSSDERPRRVRRRRRARALDQAGGERGRRRLDGRVADPRIPGGGMSHPTAEQLRPIDLFDGLENGELEHFAAAADLRELTPGAMLSELGVATSTCYFVLTGSLEASVVDGQGRYEPVGQHPAPTWVGAIPTLTGGNTAVRLRAMDEATVGGSPGEPFIELVPAHRSVFDRIMRQVRPVVGRITAMEQNRERLAGLGTMAAGLAHELNNPASAAQRAAADLAEALEVLSSTVGLFVESGVERSEAEALVGLQREALRRRTEFEALSAVQAADCEDEVLDALEALGVQMPGDWPNRWPQPEWTDRGSSACRSIRGRRTKPPCAGSPRR